MKLCFILLFSFFLFSSCNFSPDEKKPVANKEQPQIGSGMSKDENETDANENQFGVASGFASGDKENHVIIVTEGGIGVGAVPPWAVRPDNSRTVLPPILVSELVSANMSNDLQTVREILASGDYGWTELMEGVYKNDSAKVESLINSGADVNAKTWGGMSALALAVQFENIKILKILIAAEVSLAKSDGLAVRPPLVFAIKKRNEPVARLLIEAGMEIKHDWSTLANAVKSDMKDTVELMLEKGVDVKSRNELALYAIRRAMIASIDYENKEMALLLIKHGVDVNAVDKQGVTPLSYAAKTGRIEMVKMLLENGVDIDRHGGKSIKEALLNGQIKIADLLKENGVVLKFNDGFAAELLMKAATTGNAELADYLFDQNVEIVTGDLEKAVQNAVDKGFINVALSVAKKLKPPASVVATNLIYFHDQKDKCEIKIFDTITRLSRLIYTMQKCPVDRDIPFLNHDTKTLLITTGSTIQEIVYDPVVKIGPVIDLPFKVNTRVYPEKDLPYAQMLINQLSRAGHLFDGKLGVINHQEHPVGGMESEYLLWSFDKGKWTMIESKHCPAHHFCTFEELRGDSLRENMPDTEIIDTSIIFNPFIVGGGVMDGPFVENAGGFFLPITGRDGKWRYVTFSINEHETTVYFFTEIGPHSGDTLTRNTFIKTYKQIKPKELIADGYSWIKIKDKYLLVEKNYWAGAYLIDLETGETLLSTMQYAAWVYN